MKSIFKSKTFWFGVAQILAGGAGVSLSGDPTTQHFSWGAVAQGAATIGLRLVTKAAIGNPDGQ